MFSGLCGKRVTWVGVVWVTRCSPVPSRILHRLSAEAEREREEEEEEAEEEGVGSQ